MPAELGVDDGNLPAVSTVLRTDKRLRPVSPPASLGRERHARDEWTCEPP
ncbi:MAG: hypothetical protein M0Z95_09550 [Actinomycetota bacterium]|nr:hypothetical protein [Actinomycetota bacterium]